MPKNEVINDFQTCPERFLDLLVKFRLPWESVVLGSARSRKSFSSEIVSLLDDFEDSEFCTMCRRYILCNELLYFSLLEHACCRRQMVSDLQFKQVSRDC